MIHRTVRDILRTSPTANIMKHPAALALLCLAFPAALSAQATGTPPAASSATPAPPARPADPKDVASLDAIVAALYASISGPKGAPREFDRMRTLFGPNARLSPTSVGPDGKPRLRSWSVEEYITAAGPGLVANGFYEREIGRTTESFGNVWHIMSAYDSRNTLDAAPFARDQSTAFNCSMAVTGGTSSPCSGTASGRAIPFRQNA